MSTQEKLSRYHTEYQRGNLQKSLKILDTIGSEETDAAPELWKIFNKYPPNMANAAAGFALVRLGDPEIQNVLLTHLALGPLEKAAIYDPQPGKLKDQVGFAFPDSSFSVQDHPGELLCNLKSVIAANVLGSPQFQNVAEVIESLREYMNHNETIFYAHQDFGGLIIILGIPEGHLCDGREVAALSLLQLGDQESVENIIKLAFENWVSYQKNQRLPFFEAIFSKFPNEMADATQSPASFDNSEVGWGEKLLGESIVEAAGIIGNNEGAKILESLLDNTMFGDSAYAEAIKQLKIFGTQHAAEILQKAAEGHPKRNVKRKANRALRSF